jgi:nucleoside diphosphate kinase/guanylate kinase
MAAPSVLTGISTRRSPYARRAFARLDAREVRRTQRTLVILKPDCLSVGQVEKAITLIAEQLHTLGIKFRITVPTLLAPNEAIIDALYLEHNGKGWFEGNFKPFFLSSHRNPKALDGPCLAFVVEAPLPRSGGEKPLPEIIREIVGEKDPEAELEAKPEAADRIKGMVRYSLTLGSGYQLWPLYDEDPSVPMFNRLHASASLGDASREIAVLLGNRGNHLFAPHYSQSGMREVRGEWGGAVLPSLQGAVRLPLFDFYWEVHRTGHHRIERALVRAGRQYRHFGHPEIEKLLEDMGHVTEMALDLDRELASALREGQPRRPHIVGLISAPGAGKTTVVERLRQKGWATGLIPLTVIDREESPDYVTVDRERWMDLAGQKDAVGWETLEGGFLYMVQETAMGNLAPGSHLLIGGPKLVLEAKAAMSASAKTGVVLLSVTEEELLARVRSRGAARDRVRGEEPSLQQRRWLPRAGIAFDARIVNRQGGVDEAAEALALEIRRGQTRPTRPLTVKERKLLVALSVGHLVEIILHTPEIMDAPDVVAIEAALNRYAKFGYASLFRRPLPGPIDGLSESVKAEKMQLVADHEMAVTAGALQMALPFDQFIIGLRRVGRIAKIASLDRARTVYADLKVLYDNYPREVWVIYAIIHDIGKLVDFQFHPRFTGELIRELDLLDTEETYVALPAEVDREVFALACAMHDLVGSITITDYSLLAISDMFAMPEMRGVLRRKDGSVNLQRLEGYLNFATIFCCFDRGGYGSEGWAECLYAEDYLATRRFLLEHFAEHADNYDSALLALRQHAASMNQYRIARYFAIEDTEMHDRREGGFDYYWNQVVVPSVAACIERGIFSKEEWDLLLGNFHYIKSLRYSTTFVSNNLPYVNN